MGKIINRIGSWEIQTKDRISNTATISFIVRHHRIERLPLRIIVKVEIVQENISLTSTKVLPAFIIMAIRSMTSELIQDQITA
jgi:hypothetical protein